MASSISLDSCDFSVFVDSFSMNNARNCFKGSDSLDNISSEHLLENGNLNIADVCPRFLNEGVISYVSNSKKSTEPSAKSISNHHLPGSSNQVLNEYNVLLSDSFAECCKDNCSDGDHNINYKLHELNLAESSDKEGPWKKSSEVVGTIPDKTEAVAPKTSAKGESSDGKIERKWICQICEKAFRTARTLKEHEVVHTGARDYPCRVCGKAFGTSANMRIHLLTHSDQRPYECQTCGATFRQKDSLKVHVRKHTGERPFVCTVCNMAFDRTFSLKNHMRKHAEKSFVCSVCGKAFSTRGGLNHHERLHFKDPTQPKKEQQPRAKSGTGNWICDECGKIYSSRSNLKLHKRSHEPGLQVSHVCPVCSQSYKSRDSMEVHMRRHTEDRPFKCTMCSRSFYRNYTLKMHILTHTGEKPHCCPIEGCKKSFAQSSSLSCHIRNHKKREEQSLNQNKGKRPYRKKKQVQENFPDEYISSDSTFRSISTKSSKIFESEAESAHDLKLGLGSLLPQSISTTALINTPVSNSVTSMLDDISNSISHQIDHTLPAVWDDNESIAMLDLHGDSQHPNLDDPSMDLNLQQPHCHQVPLMPYVPVPPETLPLLVSVPDSILYQHESAHKEMSSQSMLLPHLP